MSHEPMPWFGSLNLALRTPVLALALLSCGVTWAADGIAPPSDSRKVYTADSPDWLRAVGKLQVPGVKTQAGRRTFHREDCSATLVSGAAHDSADIIVTAWHCLEYYSDLSKPITFTLLPASGKPVSSEAYLLTDGGGMYADWAILRLYRPVPDRLVRSLDINPGAADHRRHIAMAGYSSDADKGRYGKQLTYDPACKITQQSNSSSDSDCLAHKGASGGAVVQVSEQGKALLLGVISEGNGQNISTFVPIAGFRGAINSYLR